MSSLQRTLGFKDLVLIVVGTVIGSGIFIVPGAVLRQTGGDVGPALAVWLVGGVLSLLGALTYAELGASRPEAGGLYTYIRDAFGPLPAFLYGWTMFFVISSGSMATLAVAFTGYLDQLVPVSPVMGKVVAVLMIAVITVINVRGTRHGSSVQNWSTGVKVAAIVAMSLVLLARGDGLGAADTRFWPESASTSLLAGVGLAMIGVLWAYEGWQYVTFSAGETRDPQRTFPRAIVFGTAVLIAIYVGANLAYIAALGPARVAGTERVAAEAVGAVLGPMAGKVIAAIILVSMFSAANGLALTAPRLYYAMARDGVFFSKLAEVSPRYGTPAFAIVAGSLWAMLLAASGTFNVLLTYVVFAGWIFYGLGALSIFAYRRRERDPDASRGTGAVPVFRVPGYPVTPVLFVLASAAIVGNTLATQTTTALIGLAIVLAGAPAYLVWRSRRGSGPPPAASEGAIDVPSTAAPTAPVGFPTPAEGRKTVPRSLR